MSGSAVTIDDLGVGRRSARSALIPQQMIDRSAGTTRDFGPIHVDPQHAAGTGVPAGEIEIAFPRS